MPNNFVLYPTTEYDRFVFATENREITQSRVEFIARSMLKYGYNIAEPIHVVKGTNVIHDGQHRMLAAKLANIEAWIIEAPIIIPLAEQNSMKKPWSDADYLDHFTSRNFPAYVMLNEYMDENPWLRLSGFLHASGYAGANKAKYRIGEFVFPRDSGFFDTIDALQVVCKYQAWSGRRECITALRSLVAHPDFSLNIFANKLDMQPRSLVPCKDSQQYFDMFLEIYNYRSKTNRLTFVERYKG